MRRPTKGLASDFYTLGAGRASENPELVKWPHSQPVRLSPRSVKVLIDGPLRPKRSAGDWGWGDARSPA